MTDNESAPTLQDDLQDLIEAELVARRTYMAAAIAASRAETTAIEAKENLDTIRAELEAQRHMLLANSSDIPLSIKSLIEEEQMQLWSDLYVDLGLASNGYWSDRIQNRVKRIAKIAKAIGVTPWERCPQTVVSSGLYAAICKKAGIPEPAFLGRSVDVAYPVMWSHTIGQIERLDLED